jgi:hypothetical protein
MTAGNGKTPSEGASVTARLATLAKASIIPILGCCAPILFIVFYLRLAQVSADPYDSAFAAFVAEVLLAGTIGCLLRFLQTQAASSGSPMPNRSGLADLFASLYVAALTAFAVTILLPAALLTGTRSIAEEMFGSLNRWGLLVLALAVGYVSRDRLSKAAQTVQGLFALDPARQREAVGKVITASLIDAFAPPPLINFVGKLHVDVVDEQNESVWRKSTMLLSAGKRYRLSVHIEAMPSATLDASEDARFNHPLTVTNGKDATEVPFQITVDYGSSLIPVSERTVTVATGTGDAVLFFPFTTAKAPPSRPSDAPDYPIRVSVYQASLLCRSVELPQRLLAPS